MSEQPAPPPPGPEALRAALALLEPHAAHPATGALHDPLYELLSDGDPAHLDALRAALLRHRDHPASGALRAALGPALALPERSLHDVLSDDGPWACDDALEEVALRLRRARERQAVLQDRLEKQAEEAGRLARTGDALALVGAILAVLALVGWLGALDVWTIDWMSPPEPPPEALPPESP